ncbi:ParM/StbA family protein [Ligilactobacillus agilis]|uniref:ParM/StbA family protein n=1 Tax=Ligilactobacillus agilis TaxID=1601 RepID=UPI0025A3C2A9|nr:ParM/StbA family protein [Ligilactobacillus agilis]MDM8279208.1 ParM/StbA family protein [Ligilactobacillus agilis]
MSKKIYTVANDLGYGSMKLTINEDRYNIPSVISLQKENDITKPVSFDNKTQEKNYINELIDNLDVTITSPSVKTIGRFLIGKRATISNSTARRFNVNSFKGKADEDLSLILTLSSIAAHVVKDNYESDEELPNSLKAKVIMATALPIKEGKSETVTENYRNRFLNKKHTVTILNFEEPIQVEIEFVNVYIGLEGNMAQVSIRTPNKELKDSIWQEVKKDYPKIAESISIDDIINANNTFGIDIGEGTTDFTVITDGKLNSSASSSIKQGYGKILEKSAVILQDKNVNVKSRTDLIRLLNQPHNYFNDGLIATANEVISEQADSLIDAINEQLMATLNDNPGSLPLVIYVFGGGAQPLNESSSIKQRLEETFNGFTGNQNRPVIFIDKKFSQRLNNCGLETIAKVLTDKYQKNN